MSILIDADTTFIVQGITGREAVNLTRECLDYGAGAKIVGGVTPGRLGRDVHGVPVFDTVAQAVEHHGGPIDGSVVTVPPAFTKDAVFEAIANGVKLVVIVTERIPRGDVAQMVELADEHGARIIGPNCLGIIVPDVIKMGGIGGPAQATPRKAYSPGPVGVISRSGGMTTEMSSTLQRRRPRPVDRRLDRRRRDHRLDLRRADAAVRGRRADARRSSSTPSRAAGWRPQLADWVDRERLAAADRRLHGRPLHGRDAGHVASATPARSSRARRTPRPRRSRASRAAGITVAERIEDIPDLVKQGIDDRRSAPHELGPVHRRRGRPTGRARRGAGGQARRGLPGRHLRRRRGRRAARSSRTTSTSACCAGCASTPRRRARSRVRKLYDGGGPSRPRQIAARRLVPGSSDAGAPRGRARPPADRARARPRDRRRRRPRHLRLPPARAGRDRRGAGRPRGSPRAHRRGKFLWAETDDGGPVLGLHLGMAGRIVRRRAAGAAQLGPLRARRSPTAAGWRCATSAASAGPCSSRTSPTSARTPPRSSRDAFRARVGRGTRRSRRGCSTRASIAGVGNLLADETLWQARLSPAPRRRASSTDRGARPPAPRAARRDPRARSATAASTPATFIPHRDRGRPCPRCGTAARARHDRRPHDVLVPGLPAGRRPRSALVRRSPPAAARARRSRRPRS